MKQMWIILFLAAAFSTQAATLKTQNLNRLIEKNHAGWVARDTSVSNLSPSEVKNLLGSLDVPAEHGLFEDRNELGNEAVDWRNNNGIDWVGPVVSQGNCGSCVAFAAVATLETQYRISSGLPWLTPTFSTQQLFACGGGGCDSGWTPSSAAAALKSKGIVDSACSPYVSGSTGEDVSCKQIVCANQVERTYKIADYKTPSSVFSGSASKVKAALKNGPLITTMRVYEDFLFYGGGIYKTVSNKTEGGHAVSLVGFNDQERYWIIRNSWGTSWGENGFARISYDDASGIAGSTWSLETKRNSNYIAVQSPANHEYISGEKSIQVNSATPVTSNVVIKGEGESVNMVLCASAQNTDCQSTLDTTKLRDGRYEIYATTGPDKSQVKEFLVLNHAPQASVSFVGANRVDLSKPLVGRIEFDIDVRSTPVMPASLRFIVEDMNGKIVADKTTDMVLSQMKLGFRFNTIPNGQYKIYYVAETPFQGSLVKTISNVEAVTTKN